MALPVTVGKVAPLGQRAERPGGDLEADPYSIFFKRSPRPMYVFDLRSFEILDVNDAAAAMYGYERHELMKMSALDLRPPDEVPRFVQHQRDGQDERDQLEGRTGRVWRHVRQDGSEIAVEVGSTRIVWRGRDARLGILTDVSTREEAVQNLRRSEERYRTVVEACPLGIVRATPDYRIVDANPGFCRLIGYGLDELRTMTFLDITHPDDVDADDELAERLFRGEIDQYGLEKRYITRSGEVIWIKLTASALFDEARVPVGGIGIVEDITTAKVAGLRRQEAADDARRRLDGFTPREREVLSLVREGLSAREIAERFTLSTRTSESHLAAIYRKLGVSSRDAALHAYERLLAAIEDA